VQESQVTIRPCEERDLAAVLEIYTPQVLSGSASFEIEVPSLDEMTRRWRDVTGRGLPYIVAERDGTVVGYAYAGPYRPRPAYRYTVENSVYVAAGQERRGIGRMLLTALLNRCEAMGVRQVMAVIGDSANEASIRVHSALGFRRVGTLTSVGYKHSRWLDVVLMQRELGEGDRSPP
jgi:L-amino acid N-acyltransferase YncA